MRLHAAVAASWLTPQQGLPVLEATAKQPVDNWIKPVIATGEAHLKGQKPADDPGEALRAPTAPLEGEALALFRKGAEVYGREGHCITCHQADGEGLPAAMFPPLSQTTWVEGREERLIKLALHWLMGPIEVKGVKYPGQVPQDRLQAPARRGNCRRPHLCPQHLRQQGADGEPRQSQRDP